MERIVQEGTFVPKRKDALTTKRKRELPFLIIPIEERFGINRVHTSNPIIQERARDVYVQFDPSTPEGIELEVRRSLSLCLNPTQRKKISETLKM